MASLVDRTWPRKGISELEDVLVEVFQTEMQREKGVGKKRGAGGGGGREDQNALNCGTITKGGFGSKSVFERGLTLDQGGRKAKETSENIQQFDELEMKVIDFT